MEETSSHNDLRWVALVRYPKERPGVAARPNRGCGRAIGGHWPLCPDHNVPNALIDGQSTGHGHPIPKGDSVGVL